MVCNEINIKRSRKGGGNYFSGSSKGGKRPKNFQK